MSKSTLLLSLCTLFLSSLLTLQAQTVEKSLVKSFNLQGANEVTLALRGPVETKTWTENYLRVQMTIRLENGTEGMLKSLIETGRYNMKAAPTPQAFQISTPGLARQVTINGQTLNEQISFVVFAPENVRLTITDGAAAMVE